jgi:hypothetical protein
MFSEKSTSFYTKEINFKNYIEFTPDDIDKNYKNNNEIFEIVATDISKGVAFELIAAAILETAFLPGLITLGVGAVISSFFIKLFGNRKAGKIFNSLIEIGYIDKKGRIIGNLDKTKFNCLEENGITLRDEEYLYLLKELKGEISNNHFFNCSKSNNKNRIIIEWDSNLYYLEKSGNIYKLKYKKSEEIKKTYVYGSQYASLVLMQRNMKLNKLWLENKLDETQQKDFEFCTTIISSLEINFFSNLLKITKNLQDNFIKNKNKIDFIYVNDNKLKISKNIPKNIQRDVFNQEEFYFTKYLNENGDLEENIQETYLANLLVSNYLIAKNYNNSAVIYQFKQLKLSNNKEKINKRIEKLDFEINKMRNFDDLKEYFIDNALEWQKNSEYKDIERIDISKYYEVDNVSYNKIKIKTDFKNQKNLFGKYNQKDFIGFDLELYLSVFYGYNNVNKLEGSYNKVKELDDTVINLISCTNNRKNFNCEKLSKNIEIDNYTLGYDIKDSQNMSEILSEYENDEKYKKIITDKKNSYLSRIEDFSKTGKVFIEIGKNNENLFSIIYVYRITNFLWDKTPELNIYYGKFGQEYNKLVITDYKRKDYGIDVNDKNIFYGSALKDKGIDNRGYSLKINPLSVYEVVDNKWLYNNINIEKENQKIKLGDGISFEKEENNKYFYLDKYKNKYIYDLANDTLEINYGNNFGESVLINEFKNGDYGIDLSIGHGVLFGSKDIDYTVVQKKKEVNYQIKFGAPLIINPNSYGKGKIIIDDRDISNSEIKTEEDFIKNQLRSEELKLVYKKCLEGIKYQVFADRASRIYIYDLADDKLNIFIYRLNSNSKIKIYDEELNINNYYRIEIMNYQNDDFNITLPIEIEEIYGHRAKELYEVKQGDTLWNIAEKYYGAGYKWTKLLNKKGQNFSNEDAKKLKIGTKVYIPYNLDEFREFKKIEVNGKGIGKNIEINSNINNYFYKDIDENLFEKISLYRMAIIKLKDEKNKIIKINNFKEGNFGIWLELEPPYILKNGKITNRKSELELEEIKQLEENSYLNFDERIEDDFLFIQSNEKIKLIKLEELSNENKNESLENEELKENNEENNIRKRTKEDKSNNSNNNFTPNLMNVRLVCEGAKLKCPYGDKEGSLKVLQNNVVMANGKKIGTIMDSKPMANISSFGKCKNRRNPIVAAATAANRGRLRPMPCIPNTGMPWSNEHKEIKVGNIPVITEKSICKCMWGGTIKVTDPGQDKVIG